MQRSDTVDLVQQLRDSLRTADALLFTAKPIRQMDLDLLRMSSREAIAAADQWLAEQPAQAATEPSDDQIRGALLGCGYKIKPGQSDLMPYVYQGARAVLALRPVAAPEQAVAQPLTDEQIVDALVNDAGFNLAFRSYEDDIKFARAIERAHGIGK